MALATQCPHCHTVFRVAHDQLKLRGGIVRCGACNEIFDGNAALVEPALPPLPLHSSGGSPGTPLDLELDIEPAPVAAANFDPVEPAPVAQPALAVQREPEPEPEPEHLATDAPPSEPAAPNPVPDKAPAAPARHEDSDFDLPSEHIVAVALDDVHSFDDTPPAPEPLARDETADIADDSAVRAADDAAAADLLTGAPESASLAAGSGAVARADEAHEGDEPEFIRQANRREHLGRNARVVMRWGTPLLVLLLLLQIGTTFRNPLAARYPALAPALSALCAPFLCKVELPMQIDTLAIEQGELQTLSDNTFSFATVLRNGSRTAQAWPHIELVLNDAADKPVLRRVFAPRDYLGNPADLRQGFRPRSEQPVKLYFQLNRLKASGYHIAIFYP
ncbi:DUF3426 domain-containing protein [Pseudoduganella plicata]|nr:DUF3426 domain-containing protein [Pseudoduganella plicata]GGY72171.1 hypothetical protein GCM10007388_00200 [Pseudoduganella plicata]